MDKYEEHREKARKRLNIADHMLTMTYPLVKDSKILLAALENLFMAISYSIGSVLYYERMYKRIPPFHDNFESKFNMFRIKIVPRFKIDTKYLDLIREIRDIIVAHKKSPVEFSRDNQFVIASEDYDLKKISLEQLKAYIPKTKRFIEEMEGIVNE